MHRILAILLCLGALTNGGPVAAQSLADMRLELARLQSQIRSLETELSGNGSGQPLAGQTALERLGSLESALQRLTAASERLEFRITRIVDDGTARIAALERRVCELEPTCTPSKLPDAQRLGGDPEPPQPAPSPPPTPQDETSEERDFLSARKELEDGSAEAALRLLEEFRTRYPMSPRTSEVGVLTGRAYERLGDKTQAARAYLGVFSAAPEGAQAPEALTRLGMALDGLGQVSEACKTLQEVEARFADSPYAEDAKRARSEITCPTN